MIPEYENQTDEPRHYDGIAIAMHTNQCSIASTRLRLRNHFERPHTLYDAIDMLQAAELKSAYLILMFPFDSKRKTYIELVGTRREFKRELAAVVEKFGYRNWHWITQVDDVAIDQDLAWMVEVA
jgi:hypothetical protein